MKTRFALFLVQLSLGIGISLGCLQASKADQTDERLDKLFNLLQTSEDAIEQRESEVAIWAIWFESGREDIDHLMEQAGEVVQASNLQQAEALYSQVIEQAPDFSEGWNRRATARYYLRDYEGSLDDIEITLRLEPRHFGATWGLGMILGFQHDFSGAIAAFERLLKINPHSRDAGPRIEILKQELAKSAV